MLSRFLRKRANATRIASLCADMSELEQAAFDSVVNQWNRKHNAKIHYTTAETAIKVGS